MPIAWRLYLPEPWAQDPELRGKAQIPDDVGFQTKPQIALDQIRAAIATGTPAGVILADAGYGADGDFRSGLSQLGLDYVVGVQSTLSVWRPGEEPLPPKVWSGTEHPPPPNAAQLRSQAALSQGAGAGIAGRASHGGKGRTSISPRALPPCASGPRRVTII